MVRKLSIAFVVCLCITSFVFVSVSSCGSAEFNKHKKDKNEYNVKAKEKKIGSENINVIVTKENKSEGNSIGGDNILKVNRAEWHKFFRSNFNKIINTSLIIGGGFLAIIVFKDVIKDVYYRIFTDVTGNAPKQ